MGRATCLAPVTPTSRAPSPGMQGLRPGAVFVHLPTAPKTLVLVAACVLVLVAGQARSPIPVLAGVGPAKM